MAASMAAPWQINATFDPYTQPIMLLGPDGRTPIVVSIGDIMKLQNTAVTQSITEGIETGATLILLITLLLVTSRQKLSSAVFIVNALSLFFSTIKGVLTLASYLGTFYNFYNWETMHYPGLHAAQSVSIAGEITVLLVMILVEISLAIQVHIVCCDLSTWRRFAINAFNGLVAILVVCLRFALMVLDISWNVLGVEHETFEQFSLISKISYATNIAFVTSIAVSALLFCTKLGFAIRSRRAMGMKQFGAMHIIFVIGCQTLCTPLIFLIITLWAIKNSPISRCAGTVVVLSLPLSAMWATANTNNRHLAASNTLRGSEHAKGSSYTDTTDTSGTFVDSPTKARFARDIEMQRVDVRGGDFVHVEKDYCVRTD